jgi:hypothetical protein
MNKVWGILTLFFIGCLVVLAIKNAQGASTVFGSLFTGVNALGTTLTGGTAKSA